MRHSINQNHSFILKASTGAEYLAVRKTPTRDEYKKKRVLCFLRLTFCFIFSLFPVYIGYASQRVALVLLLQVATWLKALRTSRHTPLAMNTIREIEETQSMHARENYTTHLSIAKLYSHSSRLLTLSGPSPDAEYINLLISLSALTFVTHPASAIAPPPLIGHVLLSGGLRRRAGDNQRPRMHGEDFPHVFLRAFRARHQRPLTTVARCGRVVSRKGWRGCIIAGSKGVRCV